LNWTGRWSLRQFSKKATMGAGMASRAGLIHEKQQGIAVAVEIALDESLHVSGRFTLPPEGAPAARPITDATGAQRLLQSPLIHPRHH
jgi:hypothetical protein